MRGGVHIPNWDNGIFPSLSGTLAAPIIVRNYNGERATIECNTQAFAIYCQGSYIWFWGIELMTTGPCVSNSAGEANPRSYGFEANAANISPPPPDAVGVKLINCVIHDTAQGISSYDTSPDFEAHGNIVYYNGWRGADRQHGHGAYIHGPRGTKTLEQNFILDNFDEGMQFYGSGGSVVQNLTARFNTVVNSGSLSGSNYQYNLIIGNGTCFSNTIDTNHFFFNPTMKNGGQVNFGIWGGLGQFRDSQFTNNDVVGGDNAALIMEGATRVTVTGNRVYNEVGASALLRWAQFVGDTKAGTTIDRNQYFKNPVFVAADYLVDSNFNFSEGNGSFNDFPKWQANTGFDASSTFSPAAPTGKWISVHKNKYEQRRGNITIYNWDLSPTVDVDLSSVLSPGDVFVIQDAQNFYALPVVAGTYQGGTVSIPMTGLTKAAPLGGAQTPPHTAPLLGTFVVMAPGAANPVVGVVINPVSVTVQINGSQQFTANLIGLTGGITWSATQGTISATGLYTAPSAAGSYMVTAASTSDPSKSASATVNVTVAPPPPPGGPMNIGDYVSNHNPGATTGDRADYDSSLPKIGNVPDAAIGRLMDGPKADKNTTATGGFTFWKVRWAPALALPDGWTVVGYLKPASPTVPPIDIGPIVPPPPPPPPTAHTATLAWVASPTAGVTGYNVKRSQAAGGPYTQLATVASPGFVDHTVVAGATYFYVVTAISAGGESVMSNEASGVVPVNPPPPPPPPPPPTAPAPPSNLTVTTA